MFTSASNVVLVPKGLAKPTDLLVSVKACFYQRHIDLYGNNVCGASNYNASLLPGWYEEIEWREPMLPADWKVRIESLLKYRDDHLKKKYLGS